MITIRIHTHAAHIVDRRHTNNDFCRFVWFWLFAHWRLFILSLQLLLFSLLCSALLCFASLLFAFVLPCTTPLREDGKASRTENCINNEIEEKCSRERLLYEYSYTVRNRFACTDASNKIASIIIIANKAVNTLMIEHARRWAEMKSIASFCTSLWHCQCEDRWFDERSDWDGACAYAILVLMCHSKQSTWVFFYFQISHFRL